VLEKVVVYGHVYKHLENVLNLEFKGHEPFTIQEMCMGSNN